MVHDVAALDIRVEILERADGELMVRYQGEVVDYQEGQPPSSALWGAGSGCSSGPHLEEVAGGVASSHLTHAQRALLASLEPADEDDAHVEGVNARGRGGQGKPLRHQLHRTPTTTQQARWEAVQLAREQGLSLRVIPLKLGMARDTVGKYAKANSPPTKKPSAKERTKAAALAAPLIDAN